MGRRYAQREPGVPRCHRVFQVLDCETRGGTHGNRSYTHTHMQTHPYTRIRRARVSQVLACIGTRVQRALEAPGFAHGQGGARAMQHPQRTCTRSAHPTRPLHRCWTTSCVTTGASMKTYWTSSGRGRPCTARSTPTGASRASGAGASATARAVFTSLRKLADSAPPVRCLPAAFPCFHAAALSWVACACQEMQGCGDDGGRRAGCGGAPAAHHAAPALPRGRVTWCGGE